MIYSIEYSKAADKTLKKWKKSNPRLFKKATAILMDIMQHPRTGLGHPEPLVGGKDVTYSRHITADDRIIYDIYDESGRYAIYLLLSSSISLYLQGKRSVRKLS